MRKLFEGTDWLRVACIGGGPGSDFLGVLKYAMRNSSERKIKCFLLDRESAWGDTWGDLEEHTDDLKFQVSSHFQLLDVTDKLTWETQTKYLKADLFTFIYFLSEIYHVQAQAKHYFAHLVAKAKPGALFLFVDNRASPFSEMIQSFADDLKLQKLRGNSENYKMDWQEEKKDLEPYLSQLSHKPKIQTSVHWALMVKPELDAEVN